MITEFGDLGVVEERANPNPAGDPFPAVLYVESAPTVRAPKQLLVAAREHAHELRPNADFTYVASAARAAADPRTSLITPS